MRKILIPEKIKIMQGRKSKYILHDSAVNSFHRHDNRVFSLTKNTWRMKDGRLHVCGERT